jgi:hypothetical protein
MLRILVGIVIVGWFLWFPSGADAQDVEEMFRKVNPAVVVIKAKGREVTSTRGVVTFSEIGSGVLISADGKVMTAAHVVQAMDEIVVAFLGGEAVPARVIASEQPSPGRRSWSVATSSSRWRESRSRVRRTFRSFANGLARCRRGRRSRLRS